MTVEQSVSGTATLAHLEHLPRKIGLPRLHSFLLRNGLSSWWPLWCLEASFLKSMMRTTYIYVKLGRDLDLPAVDPN